MAFTEGQIRQLRAKLDSKHVKSRSSNGTRLSYVEGWHVIAEANRIFGFDGWDRRTIGTTCIWTESKVGHHYVAYTAKVRVRVRAGDVVIIREGSGTGEATAVTSGQAHELALKGAETDATKRALSTFGNPFGLALYDRERNSVRRTREPSESLMEHSPVDAWVLRSASGASVITHEDPNHFVQALRRAMGEAEDIELLYQVWEQNLANVRALHRYTKGRPAIVPQLVAHLRACAVALAKSANGGDGRDGAEENNDKALLRSRAD